VSYLSAKQWSEQDRLFNEKETLGLYLSGHPIHRYLSELKHFISSRISEVRPEKNKIVIIAGIITQVRSIQTKRGDRMAVVVLDDASGQMDMLCFSETYQKFRDLLVKDTLVVVEGEISIDEFTNNFRILSREIFSIEQARERYAKCLQIRLSSAQVDDMSTLSGILEKFRGGKCRIIIDYMRQNAKANLQLGDAWRVRPSDILLDTLREIFTENNVEVVYR
jgi:DNA polymerase-3 subunit alpha